MLRVSTALIVSLMLSGCFGMIDRLTADGLCGSRSSHLHHTFCQDWHNAKRFFYEKRWKRAIEFARNAKKNNEYDEIDKLIARAAAALSAGDDGPYNMRLDYCPRQVSLGTLNDMFQLLRCAQTTYGTGANLGPDRVHAQVRARLRTLLNDEDHDELTRAIYIHICKPHIEMGSRDYARRTLGCAWHAEQLDMERLRLEITGITPAERSQVAATVQKDIDWLRQRAAAAYPEGNRDRVIFFDLRTRLLAEHARFKRDNREAFATIERYHKAVARGDVATCAPPLAGRLMTHMAPARGSLEQIKARLGAGVGLLLAELLAQCHYFNDRNARSAAMLAGVRGISAPTTLAEKVYRAQYREISADRQKARRFPHLVGKTLTTATLDGFRPPELLVDETADRWNREAGSLGRYMREVSGTVSRVNRSAQGARISFKKTRVPRTDERCTETRTIDRITSSGRIIYRLKCRVTRRYSEMVGPKPIDVDDAAAVKVGRFVKVLAPRSGPNAVFLVAKSPKETSRVYRLGDIVLAK